MQFRVFVSYSRQDLHLVQPIVGLLRATRDWVFHDVDSIQPGKQWEPEVEQALRSIHLVVVFWCRHARDSDFIRREYDLAIREGKDVLPLLIDDTPLPEDLLRYQWLDFTSVAGSAHASAGPEAGPRPSPVQPAAAAPPARPSRSVLFLSLSVVAIALFGLLWLPRFAAVPPSPTVVLEGEGRTRDTVSLDTVSLDTVSLDTISLDTVGPVPGSPGAVRPDTVGRPPDVPAPAPMPTRENGAVAGLLLALAVLGLALAAGLLWLRRRARFRSRAAVLPAQQAMARDLEAALTRKEREILATE